MQCIQLVRNASIVYRMILAVPILQLQPERLALFLPLDGTGVDFSLIRLRQKGEIAASGGCCYEFTVPWMWH